MDNIINYVKKEKDEIESKLNKLNETILRYKYNVEEIENSINNLTKNIDTTYEVFSPNSSERNYNLIEIEKLNLKKNEMLLEVDSIIDNQKRLLEKKEKVESVYKDILDVQKKIITNDENSKYILEKEISKNNEKYSDEVTKLLEYQINQQNNFINRNIKNDIELLDNKISLCQNLIDIDYNRAKMELIKLKEEIENINKKISSKMFHVKHFLENKNDYSIYDEIKEIINECKKYTDFKFEFNYTGEKINVSYKTIINLIRIIKESIMNSIVHSKGNIINIIVVVDNFVNEYNKEDNIKDNNDMHQINFVIEDIKTTSVSIKISDNGNGFLKQEDNVLISNNMYGIYLMKKRAEYINAALNIKSEEGMGTVVTIVL
ncbi:MAG: hypothetical protein IJA34_01885 [Lachnospiraceae bacterium]|nr:hypothetical protein [Lachnospiraceae bacterium]